MSSGFVSATDRVRRGLGTSTLLCLLAACAGQPAERTDSAAGAKPAAAPTGTTSSPSAEAAPQPSPPPRPRQTIRIAMVGDMMLGTDFPEDRLPDDDAAGFLAAVAPVLREADLAFGNLEGVLADSGAEPVKDCSNPSVCYLFRSPPRYAAHYRAAGFDALSVANNHALDFGEEGRSRTMAALAAEGIAHSGRRGDFATLTHNGLRIAFLAFAVTRNSNLVHDYEAAYRTVADHARRHDLIVVSFHGGAEGSDTTRIPFAEETYYGEPRGNVVRFARSMVDAGADIVFGHGPHVVRGMERYNDRLIAYSLGNFATYYGISVSGAKGIAPVLVATIDQDGRFIEGQIHSTVQIRPGGPVPDPESRALGMLRQLSLRDFRDPGLEFAADGRITPVPRHFVRPLPADAPDTVSGR